MVLDGTFLGPAPVFAVDTARKVPFDQGYARDKWYIVEVRDLE